MGPGPSPEFSLAPFWFINHPPEEAELRRQLRLMAEKSIRFVWVHPRRGLDVPPIPAPPVRRPMFRNILQDRYFTHARKTVPTPYLREPWWETFAVVLDEARRLGMRVGIYDELDWPSGTASMRIPSEHPEVRAKYLVYRKEPRPGECPLLPVNGGSAVLVESGDYVDVMDPASARLFLDSTHEEYHRRFKEHFGSTIAGFFSDEVALRHQAFVLQPRLRLLPWSPALPPRFREEHGYAVEEAVPSLFFDGPGAAAHRRRFWSTATALYRDHFHGAIRRWCEERGVRYCGHVLFEEPFALQTGCQGSIFEILRAFSVPGVDHLGRNFGGVHPKIASSVAHHRGQAEVQCEAFGAAGWGFSVAEMRRNTLWLYASGVTVFTHHALYYSTEGFRKYEYPPSFFFQSPLWETFGEYAAAAARLSEALRRGVHEADAAVFYPVETLRGEFDGRPYRAPPAANDLWVLGEALVRAGRDYDFLDERALADAEVRNGRLRLGGEEYPLLFLPAAGCLPEECREKVSRFLDSGGTVAATSLLPSETPEEARWSRETFGAEPARARSPLPLPRPLFWLALHGAGMGLSLKVRPDTVLRGFSIPRPRHRGRAWFLPTFWGLSVSGGLRRFLEAVVPPVPGIRAVHPLRLLRRREGGREVRLLANLGRGAASAELDLPSGARGVEVWSGREVGLGSRVSIPPSEGLLVTSPRRSM